MKADRCATYESPEHKFWAFFILSLAVLLAGVQFALPAYGKTGFSGGVTPSRIEVGARAGDTVRRSIELYNLGERPAQFRIGTVDWTFSELGQISYHQELLEDSCRPWVRLESHEVEVVPNPNRPRPFRFEVHVPQDAQPRECRFALMVETVDSDYTAEFEQAGIKLPVSGRIAVIVYVAVGGVTSELVVESMRVQTVNGRRVPVVKVVNNGKAHGRLEGDLIGEDSAGEQQALSLSTSPLMPGQTRFLPLMPVESSAAIKYPLTVRGKIYAPNGTFAIDSVLKDP